MDGTSNCRAVLQLRNTDCNRQMAPYCHLDDKLPKLLSSRLCFVFVLFGFLGWSGIASTFSEANQWPILPAPDDDE
jgi:hypothetical protein